MKFALIFIVELLSYSAIDIILVVISIGYQMVLQIPLSEMPISVAPYFNTVKWLSIEIVTTTLKLSSLLAVHVCFCDLFAFDVQQTEPLDTIRLQVVHKPNKLN